MSDAAKKEKQIVIDEIRDKIERSESVVVIDYLGTTVAQADAMRKSLREADVDYTVYKNTLIRRAVEGTEYAELASVLEGPTALAISYTDATAPARVLNKAIKEFDKMEFKAGIVEGVFYDKDAIKEIANIPGRDDLIAKFMGSIQAPIAKFAVALKAIAEQKEA